MIDYSVCCVCRKKFVGGDNITCGSRHGDYHTDCGIWNDFLMETVCNMEDGDERNRMLDDIKNWKNRKKATKM